VNNSISKMQKNLGLFLLIGAIGFYFYRRAATTQNIKPVLRKITFGGTLIQPKIFVTLGIQNPTEDTPTINSVVGEILANGKLIANVNNFTKIKIGANSETAYSITAEPQSIGIITEILRMIKDKSLKQKFTFNGTINIGGNSFPINFDYSV